MIWTSLNSWLCSAGISELLGVQALRRMSNEKEQIQNSNLEIRNGFRISDFIRPQSAAESGGNSSAALIFIIGEGAVTVAAREPIASRSHRHHATCAAWPGWSLRFAVRIVN